MIVYPSYSHEKSSREKSDTKTIEECTTHTESQLDTANNNKIKTNFE